MARTINIPQTEIVMQPEIKGSGTEVIIHSVTDDGGCVMASWSFAGKQFNQTLWEEEEYISVGVWSDADVDAKILEILNQQ